VILMRAAQWLRAIVWHIVRPVSYFNNAAVQHGRHKIAELAVVF